MTVVLILLSMSMLATAILGCKNETRIRKLEKDCKVLEDRSIEALKLILAILFNHHKTLTEQVKKCVCQDKEKSQ